MFWEAVIILGLNIPCVLFFDNNPPTPPSFAAGVEKEDFNVALKILGTNRNYYFIAIVFSIFYGTFTALAIILPFLIYPFGFKEPQYSSILSVIPVLPGIAGCLIFGWYIKKSQKYKKILVISEFVAALSVILFLFLLFFENLYLLFVPMILIGLFIIPLIPTLLEFACEICFPVGKNSIFFSYIFYFLY